MWVIAQDATNAAINREGMRTLLFSAILYLLGIAIVLFLRPRLMFEEDGRWKEFGTSAPNHTAFPFWLFCILWAIVSYLVTLLAIGEYSGKSVAAVTTATAAVASGRLQETEPPEDIVMPLPPKSKGRNSRAVEEIIENGGDMKPGYYVLDTKELRKSGIPKYVYIGEEPDTAAQ